MHDFDPAKLRLNVTFDPGVLQQRPKGDSTLRKKRAKPAPHRFVQVPWLWVECLAKVGAGADALFVALVLLYEAWRTKTRVVKLTNPALAELGVNRKGKTRALQQLRRAGLVAVEERPGKSPRVTVRFVETRDKNDQAGETKAAR
jgi:hypothetical protein